MSTDSGHEDLLQCYNKGCGIKFKPDSNAEESCCFHPGAPIFHDAYKGWSCCNKRSTDFTTFLNMKGCVNGKHNPVKPEEPMKEKPDPRTKGDVISVAPPKEICMTRPNFNTKLERLKVAVTQSLKEALKKHKENETSNAQVENNLIVKVGESCKNNGCKASYEGEHSNLEICRYHPDVPIFHEGLKFWYCCQRKTTDFEVFLQQEGCTTGSHMWRQKNVKRTSCRYDWHQTATHVYVTVYAKLSQPETSEININAVRLKAQIVFVDNQEFDIDCELGGIIVPEESCATMAATKVEIKLRKAEPKHWNKIFLPQKTVEDNIDAQKEGGGDDSSLSVDTIDLNDI